MNNFNLTRTELRAKNIEVFKDTLQTIDRDEELREKSKYSSEHTILYRNNDVIPTPRKRFESTRIVVSGKRTGEALAEYGNDTTAVLNFASACNPGGGVLSGSGAQEESLCRISTLYPSLAYGENALPYYEYHRTHNNHDYSDTMLFTPDVVFFKSDETIPELLERKDWKEASVITSAAPNLIYERWETMNEERREELRAIFIRRISRILSIASVNNIDNLILGAFGCGAFHNSPAMVAGCFREVIEKYNGAFRIIEFAVFTLPNNRTNYEAFKKTLT